MARSDNEEETRRQLDEARGPADEPEARRQADEARSQAEKAVLRRIFGQMLPNDTPTWTIWRAEAFSKIIATMKLTSPSDEQPEVPDKSWLSEGEKAVLNRLGQDLDSAIKLYCDIRESPTTPSTQQEPPRQRGASSVTNFSWEVADSVLLAFSSLRDWLYASKARISRLYRFATNWGGESSP